VLSREDDFASHDNIMANRFILVLCLYYMYTLRKRILKLQKS